MIYQGKNNEYLEINKIGLNNQHLIENIGPTQLIVLWIEEDHSKIEIDNTEHTFHKNDFVCITEFHKVKVKHVPNARMIKWNNYFYCVINHDSEVGCKGILFYGATELPILHADENDMEAINIAWGNLEKEMINSDDSLQLEMLQMTLKRLLILLTRMYKDQKGMQELEEENIDIIREYHFLVEQHFKEKHTVAEYAELLHKSPKTLSNLFKKLGSKPPLQFIQDRKMLEAKRLLSLNSYSVSEVGYELGFSDVQSFSRFFKREEGVSPISFKE